MGGAYDRHRPRLAGRVAERHALCEAGKRAAAGEPGAVVVHGEAGVGKTRLVREVCDGLVTDGFRVLWGTCVHFGAASLPFAPILGAAQGWLTQVDDAERAEVLPGKELSGLLPVLRGDRTPDPGWLLVMMDAVLNRLASHRPTILVVDDLHWADVSSLDVLAYTIAGFRNQRLLLLGTCRDEDRPAGHPLHGWLADMRRMPSFTEIHLDRLDVDETQEQVTGLLGRTTDVGLIAEVMDRSDGNPYLTELLVRDLTGDEVTLPPDAPHALREALIARWHDLTQMARQVTQLLAVGGRPMDFEVLRRVTGRHGVPDTDLSAALVETQERGVLVRDSRARFWFSHPLLAEVLSDGMPPGEARRVHVTYAEVLGTSNDLPLARVAGDLAVHHEGAGDLEEAFHWSLRAADLAARLHASAEEAVHLERACALWDKVAARLRGSEQDRIDLMLRTSRAGQRAGRSDRACVLLEQALGMVDRTRQPLLASTLLTEWCYLKWELEAPSRAVRREGFEAVRLTDRFPSSPERARALAGLAQMQAWDGLVDAAKDHAQQAVDVARACGSDTALGDALNARAMVQLGLPGSTTMADTEEAQTLARATGNGAQLVEAAIWRLNQLQILGGLEEAVEEARAAFEEGRRFGAPHWGYFLVGMLISELLYLGRWDEARELLRDALAARCSGIPGAGVRMAAAQLAVRTGRTPEARQHLDRALELVPYDFQGLRDLIAVSGAELLVAEGNPAGARDWVLAQLELCLEQNYSTMEVADLLRWLAVAAADLAQLARDSGDPAGAAAVMRDLEGTLERFGFGHLAVRRDLTTPTAIDVAWTTAEVARCGDTAGQQVTWRVVVETCRAGHARWDEAVALWHQAQAALVEGEPRARLEPLLREALLLATELHADRLIKEVRALALLAKVSLSSVAVGPDPVTLPAVLASLTVREREVLRHLVAGRSNAEIARDLVISDKTASVHVSNILRKTGTTSRVQAAELARRLGR